MLAGRRFSGMGNEPLNGLARIEPEAEVILASGATATDSAEVSFR